MPPAPPGRATLDFVGAQAAARRRTAWLVATFALAVAGVAAVIYLAVLFAAGLAAPGLVAAGALDEGVRASALRPELLVATVAGVLAVTGVGTAFHALRLGAGGGEAVAELLGGTPVDRGTQDPALRRLVNVAEEMALAGGLPVPRLYVLEREEGINAFAAGYTPGHAVVAVTRGALDRLSRDELQGVVAHELSHVLFADTRIDLRLMAAVGGLAFLSMLGRVVLQNARWSRSSRDDRGAGGAVLVVALALFVAGAVGAFFGRLVRYAVARQREWLADATAVKLTRNPEGLAGALRKIADEGSAVQSPHAAEAAHLFFASAGGFLAGLFSTHPPIDQRIRRILPQGAARAPAAAAPAPAGPAAARLAPARPPAAAPSPSAAGPSAPAAAAAPGPAAPAPLLAFPAALARAAREPFGARAIACALLTADGAAGAAQLADLGGRDPALRAEVERLLPALAGLGRPERTALLGLALPALDRLSAPQGEALLAALDGLAAADGLTTPFELAVRRAVRRRLARDAGAPPRASIRTVDDAGPECLELLATLAWIGDRDPAAAQAALDAGVRALGVGGRWRLPPAGADLARLDRTLTRLDGAVPLLKARLVAACAAVALADARVTPDEAELVRAVAAALGQPMPPLG